MRLLIADHTMIKFVGILYEVLVKVSSFIFPADFVNLDCEVYFYVTIVLGRLFPAMGRAWLTLRWDKCNSNLMMDKSLSMCVSR